MTENNTSPEKEESTLDDESQQSKTPSQSKDKLSKKAMAIITILGLLAAVGLYFFLTSGGNGPTEEETAAPPASTGEPSASPTVVAEAESTPQDNIQDGDNLDAVEQDADHGPNPFDENGTEYIMTEASQAEWRPMRAKFINGLIGDGNIAEAVEGTTTPEVLESLKNQQPGAFKDSIADDLDTHDYFIEALSSYEYTEAIRMESGKWLFVTVSSVDDNGTDTFKVSGYKILDDGEVGHTHSHEDEGE